MKQRELWVPADRLLHVLEQGDHINLSQADRRFVYGLRKGEQGYVGLRRADRLLTALDLAHWWHLPKDQGGLADIYEDGAQYGEPDRLTRLLASHPGPKYKTDEERRQARADTYRRCRARKLARMREAEVAA